VTRKETSVSTFQNLEFRTKIIPHKRHRGAIKTKEKTTIGINPTTSPGIIPSMIFEYRTPTRVAKITKAVKEYQRKRLRKVPSLLG